jgi:hypothetical protein
LNLTAGDLLPLLFGACVLLVPSLALGLLNHHVSGFVELAARRAWGPRTHYVVFGWMGTIVHELSHAVACVLTGHRILAIKWFDADPAATSLGYVKHAYNPRSLYQTAGLFFIGTAPLVVGPILVSVAARLLIGLDMPRWSDDMVAAVAAARSTDTLLVAASIASTELARWAASLSLVTAQPWRLVLFAYLAFCIGSAIRLSRQDLKGVLIGAPFVLLAIVPILWLASLTTTLAVTVTLVLFRLLLVLYGVMALALLLNLAAWAAITIETRTRL